MCAPSRAKRRTTALPTPADAPVTTTISGFGIQVLERDRDPRSRTVGNHGRGRLHLVALLVLEVLDFISLLEVVVFLVGYAADVVRASGGVIANLVLLAIRSVPLSLWLINVPLGHELSFPRSPRTQQSGCHGDMIESLWARKR